MATEWKRLVKESSLEPGAPKVVETDDADVLVVRLGAKLCACGSMCTHFGGPLAEGLVVGTTVTCPWHNASFDLCTGRNMLPPALDDTMGWRARARDGQVEISDLAEAKPSRPRGKKSDVFVIVGAGAAGTIAAMTLRKEGFAGRVVLITAERGLPYDRTALSKSFLAGDVAAKDLALRPRSFFQDERIELIEGRRVVGVDLRRRSVLFERGGPVKFTKLLLATGGHPRPLNIPGAEDAHLLRSLGDAKRLLKAVGRARRIVLIGGGFIAMEAAATLAGRDIEAHVVSADKLPLARVFGRRVGTWFRKRHQSAGVRLHAGSKVKEIARRGRKFRVTLDDGKAIDADLVVAAVGIAPAVDFLGATGLVEDGAVSVDARLETRAPGVFAAGDIASVDGRRTEHWVHAERMGQHAARAMLGSRAPYRAAPFFWTRQLETSVQYVGFARTWDKEVARGKFGRESFLVGYFAGGALKAAAGLGRAKELAAVGALLTAGARIAPAQFARASFDLVALAQKRAR